MNNRPPAKRRAPAPRQRQRPRGKWLRWALDQRSVNGEAKLLLIALADHADFHGYTQRSRKRLVADINLHAVTEGGGDKSEVRLGQLARKLERAGLVRIITPASKADYKHGLLYALDPATLPPVSLRVIREHRDAYNETQAKHTAQLEAMSTRFLFWIAIEILRVLEARKVPDAS